MIIKKVENVEEARICDSLLTKLVLSEKEFNSNIREDFVVNNWFENLYEKKGHAIFIAIEDNTIVGYVYCKINSEDGPTIFYEALIDGIYVEENFRHQGIATLLIDNALSWLKEMNVKYVNLNVLEGNDKAIQFYKKEGFKVFSKNMRMEIINDKK